MLFYMRYVDLYVVLWMWVSELAVDMDECGWASVFAGMYTFIYIIATSTTSMIEYTDKTNIEIGT